MNAKKGLLLVAALATVFVLGRCSVSHDHQYDHDHADEAGDAQEYTCSMHPQVRSTNPNDKCPLCGMDLIPVPQDEDSADDGDVPRLRVSERAAALMEIQTKPVPRGRVSRHVRLFGTVDFDETQQVDVVLRSEGYIERLHANYLWQELKAGDAIAEIYSPSIVSALREWQVAHTQGGTTEAAARARLARLGLDEDAMDAMDPSGDLPRTYTLRAPRDGVVKALDLREGQWGGEGARLIRLADPTHLWVNLQAYETELPWLRPGQPVQLRLAGVPDGTIEGEIDFIDSVVNNATRTARALVRVPNAPPALKPGMWINARIEAETEDEVLSIPATAPLITGRRAVVYVRVAGEERPTFEPRWVELGPRAGEVYVVTDGLTEGDLVVVNGAFKIDSELQIRGRPSMMTMTPEEEADRPDAIERISVPGHFTQQMGELVQLNYVLADALADDEPAAVRVAAQDVTDHLAGIHAHQVPRWDEWSRVMRNALARVRTANELGVQRDHFETFSDTLILAVRTYGTGPVAPVKLAVCPMVHGRDGFWLQPDEDIRNPYHGAAMYSCGYIREVLVPDEHEDHDHE